MFAAILLDAIPKVRIIHSEIQATNTPARVKPLLTVPSLQLPAPRHQSLLPGTMTVTLMDAMLHRDSYTNTQAGIEQFKIVNPNEKLTARTIALFKNTKLYQLRSDLRRPQNPHLILNRIELDNDLQVIPLGNATPSSLELLINTSPSATFQLSRASLSDEPEIPNSSFTIRYLRAAPEHQLQHQITKVPQRRIGHAIPRSLIVIKHQLTRHRPPSFLFKEVEA